jgi:hypothetical protein
VLKWCLKVLQWSCRDGGSVCTAKQPAPETNLVLYVWFCVYMYLVCVCVCIYVYLCVCVYMYMYLGQTTIQHRHVDILARQ